MGIPKPKLRELKEAVIAVFSPRFTTRFPAEPCVVPDSYRGKPEFDDDTCIGCGACVNVCPTEALTVVDDLQANPAVRKITQRYDTCIFCGNCSDSCTTEEGIKLSNQWDLATLDRSQTNETRDYELQLCEKCGEIIGTKKHLVWLYEKLGPLAYTNPSLLLAKSNEMAGKSEKSMPPQQPDKDAQPRDFMSILCPNANVSSISGYKTMVNGEQLFSQLNELRNSKTLILTIGNLLRGDDAVGPIIYQQLKGKLCVEIIDAGTVPENYIQLIIKKAPENLLVIDAIDFAVSPGTIRIFEPKELNSRIISTHSLSPRIFVDMITQEIDVNVKFLGIQPLETQMGQFLSAAVDKTAQQLVSTLIEIFRPVE